MVGGEIIFFCSDYRICLFFLDEFVYSYEKRLRIGDEISNKDDFNNFFKDLFNVKMM